MSVKSRPQVSSVQAKALLEQELGLKTVGELRELPSYEDVNYVVETETQGKVIIKIHNSVDSTVGLQQLEAQEEILAHLKGEGTPRQLVKSKRVKVLEQEHVVRVLQYIEGIPLFQVPNEPLAVYFQLGQTLARVDHALLDFNHPGAVRNELIWDLRRADETIRTFQNAVRGDERRQLIVEVLEVFETQAKQRSDAFRMSVIHGDANDCNILVHVNGDPTAIALIDFGDFVHTWLVADIAIAMTYILIAGKTAEEKLSRASSVFKGYQSVLELNASEQSAIYALVVARLGVSVCISSSEEAQNPENAEYTSIHSKGGWDTLKFLLEVVGREKGSAILCQGNNT